MSSNSSKRIWITTDWEANSLEKENNNLGRMNSLARYLSENDYEVVLWFTTFNHPEKRYIGKKTIVKKINEKETVVLLHSPISYRKNMSPKRIIYHSILANKMKKMIKNIYEFPKPDLIFCSYPTEQYCKVALQYGNKNHVPVIIDARDQWPDIFERAFPKKIIHIAQFLIEPLKKKTALDFARASAICAMSPAMLQWALQYAKRERKETDDYIFISSKKQILTEKELKVNLEYWKKQGIDQTTWNICLFSSLSKTALDMDTVINGMKIVHRSFPQVRLIIGGKGDDENRLKEISKDIPYIKMMGWLNQEQMTSLMLISKVGLLCYRNTKDFRDGWGNKVGQYLSYGLPIITSADGFPKQYIKKYQCGVVYKENDANDFAENIMSIIKNEGYLCMLSDNASERYKEDFEECKVMQHFEMLINKVIKDYD